MGSCTSDFYSLIKKQHGDLFQKFLIGSESLIIFKRQVKLKMEQYDSKAQKKRQNLHEQVNQRQEVAMRNFNEVKKNLDGQIPGGISDYEQMKKVKIENILGLNEYTSRFTTVHNQINRQISQHKQQTHQQLQAIVRNAEQQHTIDPQKMRLYHEMPQQKRILVRDKGVKEFHQLIKNRIIDLEGKYAEQLNIDMQLKKLDNVISLQKVDHLTKMAKNKFNVQAINIIGGYTDSVIVI